MLENTVSRFLKTHWDLARPMLLGLSGGPDSLALLYLLLRTVKERLHVAHVDHGWRKESRAEAEQLAQLAERLGVPFHCHRLSQGPPAANLEASGRAARLQFFETLCDQHNFQAVLLAHHADDVAETTLKRLLEGVTLPYLGGLQPVAKIDSLVLWRPLLSISKTQILDWLRERNLNAFEDSTNQDSRFLRARMRTQLMPMLSSHFGKEVHPGLRRIAHEAQELRQYLDARIEPRLKRLVVDPHGLFLSLEDARPESAYELRYLVRRVIERAGLFVSREILDGIVGALQTNAVNWRAVMAGRTIVVHRRRLYVPTSRD